MTGINAVDSGRQTIIPQIREIKSNLKKNLALLLSSKVSFGNHIESDAYFLLKENKTPTGVKTNVLISILEHFGFHCKKKGRGVPLGKGSHLVYQFGPDIIGFHNHGEGKVVDPACIRKLREIFKININKGVFKIDDYKRIIRRNLK